MQQTFCKTWWFFLNSAHLQGSLELNNMENITVNSSIDRRPTGNHNQTFKKIEWKILASFLGAFTPIFVFSVLCIYHKHKHGKVTLVIIYVISSFHPYLMANVNVKTVLFCFCFFTYLYKSNICKSFHFIYILILWGISDHLTNKRNCNEKSIEEEQLCHLLNDDQQQETKQVDEGAK